MIQRRLFRKGHAQSYKIMRKQLRIIMSVAASISSRILSKTVVLPAVLGLGALAAAIVAIELLIRAGAINRFIVPMPSQVVMAFGRVIEEEGIGERFRLTFFEAFAAGVMITVAGISIGMLLYRVDLLRRASLGLWALTKG
jgi:ABC-type nitrate/sulfonate/bicarbonate transport system permease component